MRVNVFAPPAQQHAVDTARQIAGRSVADSRVHRRDGELTDQSVQDMVLVERSIECSLHNPTVQTNCVHGCPIGSLARIHEPDPPVRKALAENFDAGSTPWNSACLRHTCTCPNGPIAASLLSSC
jgi:hypothetical protein